MSHTPGPWVIDSAYLRVLSERGPVAAVLKWPNPLEHSDNLRLIAAAPELLDALKECVDNFNFSRIAMDRESRELAGQLVDEYRKVIAKAEGAQ